MLFMCPKHLDSQIDANSWIFNRVRQKYEVKDCDLESLEKIKHLKEWVLDYHQDKESFKYVSDFKCSNMSQCSKN
jgi:hypothetical protein